MTDGRGMVIEVLARKGSLIQVTTISECDNREGPDLLNLEQAGYFKVVTALQLPCAGAPNHYGVRSAYQKIPTKLAVWETEKQVILDLQVVECAIVC